jgi:uncharacterized membrane protein
MFPTWIRLTAVLTVLGVGIIAGTFFAFSTFVMKALAQLPAAQGIAAMKSINVVILSSLFIAVFVGSLLGSAVLGGAGINTLVRSGAGAGNIYLLVGGFLYVATFAITMVFNVPLNNALMAATTDSAAGAEIWKHYLSNWTLWNHVRTGTSLGATAFFVLALMEKTKALE